MLSQDIRRKFLHYFKNQGHTVVPSSPVIPHDDPTLLFNNAGMNQFKDVFLGKSFRDYSKATSSQKCIRAGGKHNDLENVGHTSRHLTFFEMLGNFSFGDYFKKQAIQFAWEVSTEVFGLDPDRIWPTVFRDDEEAFELWTQYVPAKRISHFGEKENFWAMGDTGPCGPCSELLFDRGPNYGEAPNPIVDVTGERFIEFWNLVFMQFNRTGNGEMVPLPKPSIDTGAGLERVVSLKMGVDTLFETDVLRGLIDHVAELAKVPYKQKEANAPAFRVIADHLRSLAFAIADGAQPSNVERGYVLRKILRRAVRYGRTLGFDEPFLARLLPSLVQMMGQDYPELAKGHERIAEILTREEEAFIRTLRRGGNMLNQIIDRSQLHGKKISGDDVFKLKDTYGLPVEEIELIAKDANLTLDISRYQQLEQEAKERSRASQKGTQQIASENLFADYVKTNGPSKFLGYTQHSALGKVTAIVVNGALVKSMEAGEEGMIILDQTPFYAEMGGQVGDEGSITSEAAHFDVSTCQAPFKGVIAHIGKLEKGTLQIGDRVTASINQDRRQKIANNHTATHLLHWALHHVLGEHVKQAGSVVEATRLRFDFSHHKPLTKDELRKIEDLVNEKIRENASVRSYELPYEEAQKKQEIKQFFGEKYDSTVRVVDINFSKELCGGTHVEALGTIGYFRIQKESSIAAGMRRIEATTGKEAEEFARESEDAIELMANLVKTPSQKLLERLKKLLEENTQLTSELKTFKKGKLDSLAGELVKKAESLNSVPFIAAQVALNAEEMRTCAEAILSQVSSAILILASGQDDKCSLLVRVTDDLVSKGFSALEIIKTISPCVEGSGGGKSQNAQAGGKAPHKIPEALTLARKIIHDHHHSKK